MAPGLLKILIVSMQLYLMMYIILYLFICTCILFAFISDFLKLVVYMLGYVPYITTGFTDFRKPVIILWRKVFKIGLRSELHGQKCIPLVDTGCKFSWDTPSLFVIISIPIVQDVSPLTTNYNAFGSNYCLQQEALMVGLWQFKLDYNIEAVIIAVVTSWLTENSHHFTVFINDLSTLAGKM